MYSINVPGQKKLVIDAKVSLNAYQAAFEADDEGERKRLLPFVTGQYIVSVDFEAGRIVVDWDPDF